jgi:hypothetical protein
MMAKYRITGPDGETYEINAPDTATEEEVLAYAQANFGKESAIGNTEFGARLREAEQAKAREQFTHKTPPKKPKDMYADQAGQQSFAENLGAGFGGALYGMGYLGPKSILGLDKPGEVEDWKASMNGLGTTAGGTLGQIGGYGAPAAVLAPFAGASVPVAGAIGAAEGALLPATSFEERAKNTAFSTLGAATGQAGGNAIANGLKRRAQTKTAEMATKRAQNATRDASLALSKAEGYVVPPSYSGSGLFPRFMEGISGKYKTNQLAGIKNQQVTNKLARKYLGLPEDAPLNADALDAHVNMLSQPYRDIAALPKSASYDPASALEQLKIARYSEKQLWRQYEGTPMMPGNPEARTLAIEAGNAADAIESELERYAVSQGKHDLVANLRESRKAIAKAKTVESALNDGNGDVDATKIAKLINRGKPVTGELEKVGKFANAFNDVARPPKSGDANPMTALDFMFNVPSAGIGGMIGGGPGAMLMSLAPTAARVGSRYSLLSEPVQAMLTPNYSIGLSNKVLPKLFGNRLATDALYPGAGIYGYGVEPQFE